MSITAEITESDQDGKFYVAFLAGNGETWFTSEGYESEHNGERSIIDFLTAFGATSPVTYRSINVNGDMKWEKDFDPRA